MTYKDLRSAGIINLEGGPSQYLVHILYLSVMLSTKAAQNKDLDNSP